MIRIQTQVAIKILTVCTFCRIIDAYSEAGESLMNQKQLKEIRVEPIAKTNSMYDSPKFTTKDRRLIPSHHRSLGKGNPYGTQGVR